VKVTFYLENKRNNSISSRELIKMVLLKLSEDTAISTKLELCSCPDGLVATSLLFLLKL